MRRRRAVRMGVAVMMGVVVGMGMRHGRTLYYNITGVYVTPLPGLPVGRASCRHRAGLLAMGVVAGNGRAVAPADLDVRCVARPARRLDPCQDDVSQRPAPQSN